MCVLALEGLTYLLVTHVIQSLYFQSRSASIRAYSLLAILAILRLCLCLLLTMATSLTSFWETYTAEDSFLPLYVPLVIWLSAFLYSKLNKQEFHR
jgi:amino acid permease